MNIKILPFRYVQAFFDANSRTIYLNENISNLEDNLKHEFCHYCSGDPDHTEKFKNIADEFGIETPKDDVFKSIRKRYGIPPQIAANIGNISGIQNILVDYHLLASYRKFSQRVLGSEGHWEVIGETDGTGDGDSLTSNQQLIRLYPTPKGSFPVVVQYIPVVNHFRSPQARYLTYEMMLAEARIAIGNARRKINGMPTPDGGSISFDGAELISEGEEKKKEIINEAILLGEPLSVHTW